MLGERPFDAICLIERRSKPSVRRSIKQAGAEFVLQKTCFCKRSERGTGPCPGRGWIVKCGVIAFRLAEAGWKSKREVALGVLSVETKSGALEVDDAFTNGVVSTALKNDAAGSSHDERSAAIVESAPQASAVRLLPPMNPGDPIPAPREVTVQWRPAKPAND